MASSKLTDYLDEKDVKYITTTHSNAYTAQEIAALTHTPGKNMAKSVILKADGELVMIVLPSTHDVDVDHFGEQIGLGADAVDMATEDEFSDRFPDCEVGAMPPFGNLYDMRTFVVRELTEDDEIAFNAGNHRELIKMSYDDFENLSNPEIIDAAVKQS